MLYKLCPHCDKKKIPYIEKYCENCANEVQKDKVENNRHYDKNVRKNGQ
jgi:predicted amidophosphoribosyltransferase